MKVLEPGRKQTGWATEAECTGSGNSGGGCGAVLLVEAADIYLTQSGHYGGSTDFYTTFRCPCCKVETDLEVPGFVRQKAEARRRSR
jgi:uncharacterized protein YjdB